MITKLILIHRAALLLLLATLNLQLSTGFAQSTAFTYQGRLTDNGLPAHGNYDLRFSLRDAFVAGNPVGTTNTVAPTTVSNGLFTVMLDFGTGVFTGPARWLELGVRANGSASAYITLSPRQPLTPAPSAIFAHSASNLLGNLAAAQLSGPLPASQLSGVVSLAQLPASLLTNNQSGVNLTGSFTGNGSGLTGLWRTGGNAGTTAGVNFLGTTDNQPLELKVNGRRALRLEDNGDSDDDDAMPDGAPNVILGSPGNFVAAGVVGATIGGGGATNFDGFGYTNKATGHFSTVVGGLNNTASGSYSTAMGIHGVASGFASTAMGFEAIARGYGSTAMGFETTASNTYSTAMGIFTVADGYGSTAMGYATKASGTYSTAIGFQTAAKGDHSTAMGQSTTASGDYSTAIGYRGRANHDGSLVWADYQEADFASTAVNQFSIRAQNGLRLSDGTRLFLGGDLGQKINLYNTTFGIGIQSSVHYFRAGAGSGFAWYMGGVHNDATYNSGGGTTLMQLDNGGLTVKGTFVSGSDRDTKENFAPVEPRAVLEQVAALPLSQWNYKADAGTRHLGPMAQDFYAAFGIGPDDKHIATVDADGVALAAIQGLNQIVREKDAKIRELEKRLAKLESLMLRANEP